MSLQLNIFATGRPAVDAAVPFTRLQLDEQSWVDVARHFLHGADTLFEELRDSVDWVQYRRPYGVWWTIPRCRWYGGDEPLPHRMLVSVRMRWRRAVCRSPGWVELLS